MDQQTKDDIKSLAKDAIIWAFVALMAIIFFVYL